MPRPTASVLVLVAFCVAGCKRAGGPGGSFSLASGDVGDTTVHFGQLDTALLTNGSGWVRKQPGVMPPDLAAPQQLQAPQAQDSAFAPVDSVGSSEPPASPDARGAPTRPGRPGRPGGDSVADTLPPAPSSGRMPPRPRRDSVPARPQPPRPDTTLPDSTG